ncbi:MAG: hypothetical protein M3Y87_06445 [Myxococcota bacterium]|nr:hypothetical protein [Myxococcota bacterium]
MRRATRVAVLASSCLALLAACVPARRAGTGAECEINSECATPLVCRIDRCRNECATSADCPARLSCVLDQDGLGACQLPEERDCSLSSDCPGLLVCRQRQCVNECLTSRDCLGGAMCVETPEGRGCIDPGVVPCVRDGECGAGSYCLAGRCRTQCFFDRDCRRGFWCDEAGRCLPPPRLGRDAGANDAGVPGGEDADIDGGGMPGGLFPATPRFRITRPGVETHVAALVGGQLVFVTKPTGTAPGGTIDVLDLGTMTWSSLPFPEARWNMSWLAVGTTLYMTGGGYSTPGGDELSDVLVYDSVGGAVTPLGTSTSEPRSASSLTLCGDTLVVAGGTPSNSSGSGSTVVDLVDLVTPTDSTAISLPEPRTYLAAASDGSRAYVGGGMRDLAFGGDYGSDTLHVIDCALGTSSSVTMPHVFVSMDPEAFILGTRVYFAGTTVPSGTAFIGGQTISNDVIDVYDLSTSTWSTLTVPAAAGIDATHLAMGGGVIFHASTTYSAGLVQAHELSTERWSAQPTDFAIRQIAATDSMLYVVGQDPVSRDLVIEGFAIPP